MYFCGIYHNINLDFLNPEVSCAVELYRRIALRVGLADSEFGNCTAIYETSIVEGRAMIALLIQMIKWFGFAIGISFHVAIRFTGDAFYMDLTRSPSDQDMTSKPDNCPPFLTGHEIFRMLGTIARVTPTTIRRVGLGLRPVGSGPVISPALHFSQMSAARFEPGILHGGSSYGLAVRDYRRRVKTADLTKSTYVSYKPYKGAGLTIGHRWTRSLCAG